MMRPGCSAKSARQWKPSSMSITGSRWTGACAFGLNSTVHGPLQHSCTVTSASRRGGELADRRPAVDVIDRLEIDVLGEIEMPVEALEAVAALLVGHRAGQYLDAVPRHRADDEVAAMLELRLAQLLRLAMNLAAMGDADVR